MRKIEFVYRELLFQAIEKKNHSLTQKGLGEELNVSLSNVNHSLKPLRRMKAVKVNPRNFSIVNPKKILFYWASIRKFQSEIAYTARVESPVQEMEKRMPADVVFTAYTGYKFRFKETPADYSEVYVYCSDLKGLKNRFSLENGNPNLFVLKKDPLMERYGKTACIGQMFVDLWNLPEWYAADFLKALEGRINALLE